jgi:uncharacterized membrane protein YdjX (TVP38/TMEM64 family)
VLEPIKRWWKFVAIVALPIGLAALFLANLGGTEAARTLIARLQAFASEWWAIPLFVVAYIVCSVFLLPIGVLSVAAAVAWGWKLGGTIELVTCTLAALVPYALAHGRAAAWIERRIAKLGGTTPSFEGENGTFVLLLLRIVPLMPFVAMNYVAGLARVRTRDYVWTTFLGSLPSVYVFAYFVDTMAAGATGAATQLRLLAACLAVAAMAIIARWLGRRFGLLPR